MSLPPTATLPLFDPLSPVDNAVLTPLLRPRRYEAGRVETVELIGASRPKVNAAFGVLVQHRAIRRQGKKLLCRMTILGEIAEAPDA